MKKGTDIPVLLPSKMTTEFNASSTRPAGAARTATSSRSARPATATRATACFVAEFRGRQGGKPSGKRKVKLAQRPHRLVPAQPLRRLVRVAQHRVGAARRALLLEAKLGTQKTERKLLTRLANSAIRSGAR